LNEQETTNFPPVGV